MKKFILTSVASMAALAAFAQSGFDGYQLSHSDLRGTARFMSMGGAFTALGGDMSSLNQNPAGIGIYRKSEVSLTVDFNMTNSKMTTNGGSFSQDKTHVYCNNFGYVGAVNLGGETFRSFSWGASYSRVASFDRTYYFGAMSNGTYYGPTIDTSLSNYIAYFSNGYSEDDLLDSKDYNPYNSNVDWLSILAYNSYLINPGAQKNSYMGLWKDGTSGNAGGQVRERGGIDEYSIDFGGNISDVVYWGLGFGITDISFTQEAYYNEELTNARVPNRSADGTENGDAYYELSNYKNVSGNGFNMKFGLIVKPVQELRLGFAIHTPTWYSLQQSFDAGTNFSYSTGYENRREDTDYGYYEWKLRSPWKMMFGVAGVIGSSAIISVDYQLDSYNNMNISDRGSYMNYDFENNEIKKNFKAQNTIRVGAEYRVLPEFSLRAGYVYQTSGVDSQVYDGATEVYLSGTNPAYTVDDKTQYVTLGAGYRYKNFYADLAYINKQRTSSYHAFTGYNDGTHFVQAPKFDLKSTDNNIVITLGVRF
ncbi:MAG: hypothetical protein K2O00_07670 [Muribaculaceae bacterium]|nr:hypothetical protein [Muribaculaceae bacterium]